MSDETFAFPLSFAQQRLWFLDQLAPGNAFYNIPAAFRFSFALSVPLLERCVNEIVRRHEALRTTFQVHHGEPVQVVTPSLSVSLPVIDLRHLPEADREHEASRLATEEARRPFDLSKGPLLRTTLLRLAENDYVYLLTLHHIISDGWSMLVFSRELTALYSAFALGRPSPLPELSLQYADYALWQREFLQGERLSAELAWWKERLANLPVLQLPLDRPRPAVASYEGASYSIRLPPTLCAGLRALSQREGVTLFMTLLAGFHTLLHRYSGQDELVVGAPVAGRDRAEIEGLIGFFVNTLVLRTDLSGDPTFRELLGRIRQVTTDAYAHQHVPFEKLVDELQPERNLSRNPLFQVIFQLFSNLGVNPVVSSSNGPAPGVQRGSAAFDLAFNLWEGLEDIVGQIEYSTALYDPDTIVRMAGHFQMLLEGIVANPDSPISRFPLLSAAERHQLVAEWGQTATPYPRERCVHEVFEEVAQAHPARVAVEFAGRQWTYLDLNARANRLASHLRARGVGPEVMVGVCLERGLDLIVALLAILKAGGAYVPLDPQYPEERLKFMAKDCELPMIVTVSQWSEKLSAKGTSCVCLDHLADELAGEEEANPASGAGAGNLAYVMYTSGSTGQPKGVCVVHRGVVRLVRETNYVNLGCDDVLLQLAPVSFDASTFEIWGALLNGARLVVFPPHTPSLEELGRFVEERGITTLWLTSSLFQQMVDGPIECLRQVRQLLAGGDILPLPHVRKLFSHFNRYRLVNGYGPTENTTFTCCHSMTGPPAEGSSVPIGRPISNTTVCILDPRLQPVPIGVPGELFIGGDGLARGYHRRPELTAERFVPDPFSPKAEARLYRTGDLARYRMNGDIEFLGRADQQVKIRGYRVELGEIEAVLLGAPGLREVAVAVKQAADGDRSLVAYCVPSTVKETTPGETALADEQFLEDLQRFARRHLPDFMVPSSFLRLDALPLSPNGKVDRRGLPQAQETRPRRQPSVPPRTEGETLLAAIWREVLQVPVVGVHDHFFADLGGHSLRATQLVSRIRHAFGVDMPLRAIFEAPTIAELALVIEDQLLREVEALSESETGALLRS